MWNSKGYPDEYGLLKIDNEIITYTGITSTSLLLVVFVDLVVLLIIDQDLNQEELVFSSTSADIT